MNINGALQGLVTFGATWVLWLLLGLSLLSVAIMLERALFFARTGINAAALNDELRRALAECKLSEIKSQLEASRSLEARIVSAGVDTVCAAEAEERMAAEAQLQRLRSEQYLAFLGTLGNNAPFIGLLGTVLGVIGAFAQLDVSGGQLTTGLMAAIGEALIATAVGLLVALPAVAAYNAFQRLIQVRLQRGDALGRVVVAHLHALSHGAVATPSGGQ
jgi:biopolymer transport protein ExbB/TolQ